MIEADTIALTEGALLEAARSFVEREQPELLKGKVVKAVIGVGRLRNGSLKPVPLDGVQIRIGEEVDEEEALEPTPAARGRLYLAAMDGKQFAPPPKGGAK